MEEVKKTKKKNKVASLLLALALILTCGVAGTIAQYTKSLGGTSTATVAKFKVSATNLSEDIQNTDINLFTSVVDTYTNGKTIHTGASGDESTVKANTIAPGTGGSIPVTLTNESDVAVDYTLTVELIGNTGVYNDTVNTSNPLNNQKIPLQFALVDSNSASDITKVADSAWVNIDNLTSSTNGLKNTKDTLAIGNPSADTKDLKLFWRWAYGDTSNPSTSTTQKAKNDLDTAIGESLAANGGNGDGKFTAPQVRVTVLFTQKD